MHAVELRQKASNFEDALSERPTSSGIEHDVRSLARKAGHVTALLDQLHRNPGDAAGATRLEPELRKVLRIEGNRIVVLEDAAPRDA